MAQNGTSPIDRIRQELAANKQKAAILGGLLLVLIILAGRWIGSRSAPDPAAAAALAVAPAVSTANPAAPVVRPVPQELKNGPAESPNPSPVLNPASLTSAARGEAETPARPTRAVPVQDLPRSLHRNLFSTTNWSRFPAEAGYVAVGEEGPPVTPPGESWWTQMQKAVAEQREHLEKDREQLAGELAELKLQSTMIGPVPIAYISGRLVHEGDLINGFSVVSIEEKAVRLRKNGLGTSLTMP
jgi:hypothetical protein